MSTVSRARDRRRQSMIDDVVDAAWELVHEQGLAGLSMRDLGQRVGLHASSIYQYFPSKLDIYDALVRARPPPAARGDGRPRSRRRPRDGVPHGLGHVHGVLHRGPRPLPAAVPANHPGLRAVRGLDGVGVAVLPGHGRRAGGASGSSTGRTSISGRQCRSASRTSRSPTIRAGSDGHRSSTEPSTCSSRSSERRPSRRKT